MTPSTQFGGVPSSTKTPSEIRELVLALTGPDPAIRSKAREALVALGKPAVPLLIPLLSHRKPHIRWEAAKSLGGIADPIAASALVNALEDRDDDVRWLAAEALIALGHDGLHPLLAALIERAHSGSLCQGAHHVCHALVKRRGIGPILRPVLIALGHSEPETASPPAAYIALSALRELPQNPAASSVSKCRKP